VSKARAGAALVGTRALLRLAHHYQHLLGVCGVIRGARLARSREGSGHSSLELKRGTIGRGRLANLSWSKLLWLCALAFKDHRQQQQHDSARALWQPLPERQ
jgi:hypothetical protein